MQGGDLKELAQEYRESRELLVKRIKEIEDKGIGEHDEELKLLYSMARDISAVIQVLEHYYERGYWRNEDYTLNARKSRKHYAPFYYDVYFYEEDD